MERFKPLTDRLEALLSARPYVRLAIDGRCASGKSTLAAQLAERYGARLVHMDDFYVPIADKTPERLARPGGNADWERFLRQVLSLPREADIPYVRFDCASQRLMPPQLLPARALTIIEGSYSMHPMLREHYDLSVFLSIDPERQQQRLLARNGPEGLRRFNEMWIPLEEAYFSQLHIREHCDLSFDGG